MAVSDRIPAVTGNRSGMWRGARALPPALKFSGPPRPAGPAGGPGSVREASLEALILAPLDTSPAQVLFPCRNKGFAAHKILHPEEGEVIDIKESFPI